MADASGDDGRKARSRATRRELIKAARRIFTRDGFELARIEDIATLAGKTRGAFYANFEDKEDVFFALMEEEISRDLEAVRLRLEASHSPEERLEALARHLLEVCRDNRRMLLGVEFKLYAIRHPEQQRRLAQLHTAMSLRCADMKIEQLLPELQQADVRKKRRQAALFSAVLDGLSLNRSFDPSALGDQHMLKLIRSTIAIVAERRGPVPSTPAPPTSSRSRARPTVPTSTRRERTPTSRALA